MPSVAASAGQEIHPPRPLAGMHLWQKQTSIKSLARIAAPGQGARLQVLWALFVYVRKWTSGKSPGQ